MDRQVQQELQGLERAQQQEEELGLKQ